MPTKLQPLTIDTSAGQVTLFCKHRDEWPPGHARLGESAERLRARGIVDENKYQQLQTWEKICGLTAMSDAKCPTCPMAQIKNARGQFTAYVKDMKNPPSHLPYNVRVATGKDSI